MNTHPTQMDEVHTTFNVSYDVRQTNTWGNNQVILVSILNVGPSFFSDFLTKFPEQGRRLLSYFDNYQQWTIKKITHTWIPRYTDGLVQNVEQLRATSDLIYQNATVRSSFITVVQDLDDQNARDNLDEYFQARDQPNAKTWPMNSIGSYSYTPFVMDVTGQQNLAAQREVIGSITALQNMTTPVPFKWFSTKAYNESNSGYTFNIQIGTCGAKMWQYCPFNYATPGFTDVCFGQWRVDLQLAFKYPDYRLPIPQSNLLALQEQIEEMNALVAIEGEHARLVDYNQEPSFISDLSKARKHVYENSGSSTRSEAYDRAIKRLKKEESEASSSPQTQQSPISPVPVDDHSSL